MVWVEKGCKRLMFTNKENQLGDMLEIGAKIEHLLKNLSPFEQKKEREAMLKFYEKLVAYWQKKVTSWQRSFSQSSLSSSW